MSLSKHNDTQNPIQDLYNSSYPRGHCPRECGAYPTWARLELDPYKAREGKTATALWVHRFGSMLCISIKYSPYHVDIEQSYTCEDQTYNTYINLQCQTHDIISLGTHTHLKLNRTPQTQQTYNQGGNACFTFTFPISHWGDLGRVHCKWIMTNGEQWLTYPG